MNSISSLLRKEDLTKLTINYNFKTGKSIMTASKEWTDQVNWANYRQDFSYCDLLTTDYYSINNEQTWELFRKNGLEGYLAKVVDLLVQGKHIGIEVYFDAKLNICIFNNMHSNTLGLDNGTHAIRSGGIRRHGLEDAELDVIIDGLNLSRGMSFKNAAASIPFGGSKLAVYSEEIGLKDWSKLGFVSYVIDRSRSFTGPDMGLSPEHADVINERFSRNITGGFKSKIGPTGKPTAHGVYLAVKAASGYLFKNDQLKGKTVAVQGLGAVGWYLAEYYFQDGANLIITDRNKTTTQEFLKKYEGNSRISVVEPEEILFAEADIFSPAAVGGVITEEIMDSLKFKIIMGPANNQIKASGAEEEIRIARLLKERGILFQVDWAHNIGGVLAGWDDYLNKENSSLENIQPIIEKLCPANTLYNLTEAKKRGITPTEVAYQTIENQIYK